MNSKQYRELFDKAKTQDERDKINLKFEKSIHRNNQLKKLKNILPILDFFIAIFSAIVGLIALFK